MNFEDLPKVELHLHLDCSLSFQVVHQLMPSINQDEYQKTFIAPAKCIDLADYLKRATKGFELMQSRKQIRLVTLDLFQQLQADNVIYAEIRFAPLLHTKDGLTPEEVVEIVNVTVSECCSKFKIEAGIILCTLRRFTEEQSLQTAKLVKKYQGTNVIGFDIAGNEAGFSLRNHVKAFQFAIANNINCTAHAGEAKGSKSVWETLEHLKASRIGHGVTSISDEELLSFIKNNKIHLELCPTSNIQVNVFDTIQDHPINKIFDYGISCSINTDARTISNVTLSQEYQLLNNTFDWKKEDFKKCNLEAIEHSFASEETKKRIRTQIENAY